MASAGKCPICGKKAATGHLPFCSDRCRNLDLANWLGEKYAIPVMEEDDRPDEED